MRRARPLAACLVGSALLAPVPARAAPGAPPTPAANLAPSDPLPDPLAAAPGPAPACGAQAARYEGAKGFTLFATRLGRIEVQNPLRPLTPEVTQVLQVTIAGKLATAYGQDLATLRRGGSPGALEATLGGPIRWQAGLPALPDPIDIVSEAGQPLARLAFRGCAEPPAVKAPPEAARQQRKPAARKSKASGAGPGEAGTRSEPAARKPAARAAPKVPPGFSLPQGAVPE